MESSGQITTANIYQHSGFFHTPDALPVAPNSNVEMTLHTLLDDDIVELQFHLGSLDNAFFHRVLCYKPEHFDLLHLTNPVCPVLRQPITEHPLVIRCACIIIIIIVRNSKYFSHPTCT